MSNFRTELKPSLETIIQRLIDSNDALTRKLLSQPDDIHGPQMHYIFGKPLAEVARIIDEHELRLPEPLPNASPMTTVLAWENFFQP